MSSVKKSQAKIQKRKPQLTGFYALEDANVFQIRVPHREQIIEESEVLYATLEDAKLDIGNTSSAVEGYL